MYKWRIIRHENGGIGGKFSGTCYAYPGGRLSDSLSAIPVKARFKHDDNGPDEQYIWGCRYYGLMIEDNTDFYNLKILLGTTEYLIADFGMDYDETYNVETYLLNSEIFCIIKDKWNNLRYRFTAAAASTVFGISNFYIGAKRESDGSASGNFSGVMFAFQYFDYDSSNYVKLIFRKNYLGVTDGIIPDHFGSCNAAIHNAVSSTFWSASEDISDYVVDISDLKYRTDQYNVPQIQRANLTVHNSLNLKIDDIVTITDLLTDTIQYIYRVKSITIQEYNLSEIELEDVLGDLADVYMSNCLSITPSFSNLRHDWWNIAEPVYFTGNYQITEYFQDSFNPEYCWISIMFLFRMLIGILELENLLDIDMTDMVSALTYLKHDGADLNYKRLSVNMYVLNSTGNNKNGECQADALKIFRGLLDMLRLSYRIIDSKLKFVEISNTEILYPEQVQITFQRQISDGVSGFLCRCIRLSESQNYWDDDIDWSDTVYDEYYITPSDEMLKDSFELHSLPDHINIGVHGDVNNHFEVLEPSIEQQLTESLNRYYSGRCSTVEYSHSYSTSHLSSYLEKVDDIIRNTSKVELQTFGGGN